MAKTKRALSTRLQMIYDQLLPGEEVWDLCCDHGYLGLHAHASAQFGGIHFVDQAVHLIEALREQWGEVAGLTFFPLAAQRVDQILKGNVVAAGVGAESIRQIIVGLLDAGKLEACRLVLGPHKDSENLQPWLEESSLFRAQYALSKCAQVTENGRVRDIFVFERR